MADTKELSAAVVAAAREIGEEFTAYTERDGGPWYLIAGERESWHGAQRVADTETGDRDKARALLLHMMGKETPGYAFAADERRGLFWRFTCNGGGSFTVWTDEACRAFPDWAASIGMQPRTPRKGEG